MLNRNAITLVISRCLSRLQWGGKVDYVWVDELLDEYQTEEGGYLVKSNDIISNINIVK